MRRPNILLLYTDQQRYDALGASGNREIKTPNLDKLAAQGINYRRFFVQAPVCMPSRMSFLSGQYPTTLGVEMGVPMPQDVPTLPGMLHPYGYVTANIGKLHFLPHSARDHRIAHPTYGFDHLEIADEPGCYEDAYRAWVRRQAPQEMDNISVGLAPATEKSQHFMGKDNIKHPKRSDSLGFPFPAPSNLTFSAFVADQTMEFMRQNRDEPFLCVAGFYLPHSPWVVPKEFLDLYDPTKLTPPKYPPDLDAKREPGHFDDAHLRTALHGYYASVSEVDHHVGRILSCLTELGLDKDTIVVFTSDHGEWLGEFQRFNKGYPADDAVSRVPCIIRNGQGGPAGLQVDDLVEAIDIVPTILSWAGIQMPPHLQGRPLGLDGRSESPRTSALTEGGGWKTLRMDKVRYLCHGDGREFLYDLSKPLGQYKNLAADPEYAEALMAARKELNCRMIERERFRPRIAAY